jgi:hypothetical protein
MMNEDHADEYDGVWDNDDDDDYDEYDEDMDVEYVNYTLHYTYDSELRRMKCERKDWADEDWDNVMSNPNVDHIHLTDNEDGSIIRSWTRD